jgi:hypothetical protein
MAKKIDYGKLDKALRQASKAAASGKYTTEQINQYILDSGFKSMKAFENAVKNRASIAIRKNVPTSEKGVLQGYAREVLNGLSMGLWGQAESLVSSLVNGTPWDYEKDLMRTERAEYQDANPVHSTVGNLGGAMLTGAGLTKAAFSKLPVLAPQAGAPISSFAKEAGVESVLGAAEGGVTALAEGGDVGSSTGLGSAMGVLGTGASRLIDPITGLMKQGGKWVGDKAMEYADDFLGPFSKEPTLPEKRALDKLNESYTDDGMTPEAREAKIKEFEEAELADEVSPRFLGGENTNQLAKDAVIEKGPQKQKVKEELLDTMESDRGRVQQFMDDGLGYNKEGSPQVVDELMEKRSRDAAPHYEEAFASKNIESDVIDEVMTHSQFRDAYREAQATNNLDPNKLMDMPDLPEGRESPIGGWSIYALDQVKKIIDLQRKLPPSAQNAPNKKLAKHLGEQTEIMLGAIDDVVPSYGTARKIWSGSMEETEAYELGMKAYNTGKKVGVVRSEFNKLKTEAEREMYRLGASTEAIGKMDQAVSPTKSHSKVFSTPDQLAKHQILFGDPEAAAKFTNQLNLLDSMHRASSDQMPRSDSGANIIRFIRQGLDIATTSSGATGAISKIATVASDPLRLAQQRATNKAVGDKMSVTGVEGTRQVEKQLANRQKELSDSILQRGVASGGITAAGAHLLGSSEGDISKKKGSLLSTSY